MDHRHQTVQPFRKGRGATFARAAAKEDFRTGTKGEKRSDDDDDDAEEAQKAIDTSQPGNIAGKLRMMKDSRNLRFRQLHHPPDPTVVIIFVLFISTLAIFHLYIRPKYFSASSVPDPHAGNNAHVF